MWPNAYEVQAPVAQSRSLQIISYAAGIDLLFFIVYVSIEDALRHPFAFGLSGHVPTCLHRLVSSP